MELCKATGTQMTEPKTIQKASLVPDRELWKSAM
jgi:hypothetical protein